MTAQASTWDREPVAVGKMPPAAPRPAARRWWWRRGLGAADHRSAQDGAALAMRAIMAAPAGHLVLGPGGTVLLANPGAAALGMVQGGAVDPRIRAALENWWTSPHPAGQPGDALTWEIADDADQPRILRLQAEPLGADAVLVSATDESAARHAENVRRDFVANVSHELKSPVAAIGLLAEAVAQAADEPGVVRDFAERMQHEASRLGTLITELIALSAIQDGTLDEVDLVDVDQVVAAAVDRSAVAAAAARIEILVDTATGATVLGDRSLLVTAIGNLVENAVHYSGPGSTVRVTRRQRRGHILISVADTGIGIAPKDQRRVFERFFRADPARSRATGGTGLGLAIVKHVAANHGGSIGLFSRPGVGSTFTLRLPLAPPPGAAASGSPPAHGTPAQDTERAEVR